MICTATVLGANGLRQCVKEATHIATDPRGGERFYRCQEHAERGAQRFKFKLEKLPVSTAHQEEAGR